MADHLADTDSVFKAVKVTKELKETKNLMCYSVSINNGKHLHGCPQRHLHFLKAATMRNV